MKKHDEEQTQVPDPAPDDSAATAPQTDAEFSTEQKPCETAADRVTPAEDTKDTQESQHYYPNGKKHSVRSWWIKTVLMLVLIGASVAVMFTITNYISDEGTMGFKDMVRGINLNFFLILIGVLVVYIFVESAKYAYMLKISTGKFRFRIAVKTMFLGKYYDGITPMSTGGQPFQIYYLHKKQDLPKGAATAIPLIRYLVSALVVTLISITLLIITPYHLENSIVKTTTVIMSWISIALNCLFPIVIIVFSFIPKRTERLIAAIIKLLSKMHIVKHQYAVTKKWVFELREYSKAIKSFGKKFWQLIPVVILSGMETMLSYSIPFFTVIAIAGVAPTAELYVQILCFAMITRYTALLIPTPGNTGAVETTGSLLLITMTASVKPLIGWVVLAWRFFTYYIYILTGIGINIFEIIRGAVRKKRNKNQKE